MNCANHPDRERVVFCQNCGKPLCEECKRTVGNSVFCGPCYAARSAAPPPPGGFTTASGYSYGPTPGYVSGPPRPPRPPEPALAALLGFIPGVGAMYNEQYAKGIVHLVVFAILVSLTDNASDLFGWFVAAWIFYMAFEAYHTARARRDGTPLPDPFGLNDLGERLGFGKSWPTSHVPHGSAPPYDPTATHAASAQGTPPPGAQTPPAGQAWSGPAATYFHRAADGSETYSTPEAFFHRAADGSQTYSVPPASHWGAPYDVPPVPPIPTYPEAAPQRRTVPTGALWLIGLGVLFLVGHAPVFRVFHGKLFIPFLLIGIGVWMFVRRMTETGHGMEDDGSDFYRWRLTHALNGSIWVVLVGVLWLLNSFGILTWAHSWPIWMIAAGVLMIVRRTLFAPGYGTMPPNTGAPSAQGPAAPEAPVTTTEIVPAGGAAAHLAHDDHEEER